MTSEVDDGKGLVKVYWKDIRKRVAKVEPIFARLVDELDPDKTFPIYLVYLPYGALKGDTKSSFIPKNDGGFYRLSDPEAPKDVIKHLGYGRESSPLGMVLEKQLEYFIDLKEEGITIPRSIYLPGAFFSYARNLSQQNNRIYSANGVLTVTSGARSVFMLPNIGCSIHHCNLQRDFNVQSAPPKALYEHWHVFKEIVHSDAANCDWRSCLLYFSEKWVNKLHADPAWSSLKIYLHELAWHFFEYERNRSYYDIAFSLIQKKRNLKPNPYLADTAKHLFATALGAAPGYIPAIDDEALPLATLQKAFVESYTLKKYYPSIMQPAHYKFETDNQPIYYSLQHPSIHAFSPKSRTASSTLIDMRELEYITRIFSEELRKDDEMCSNTIISKIANEVEFKYFHNKTDRHRIVRSSDEIEKLDKRFRMISTDCKTPEAGFSSDAKFVRGCVRIMKR